MFKHIKEFFFLNLSDYENIGIDFPLGIFLTLTTLLLCVFAFVITKRRCEASILLKQLFRHEAFSEEKAKTLHELRIKSGFFLTRMLTGGGELKSIVKRVGEENLSYEEYMKASRKRGFKDEKIDFSSARFFICPESADRARSIYESETPSFLRPIMLCLMLLILLVCLSFLVPELLERLNISVAE